MTAESMVVGTPGVLSAEVEGEVLLLDPNSGTYYGLNATASVVWQGISKPVSLGAVCDALCAEYATDRAELWSALVSVIGDLAAKNLVCVSAGSSLDRIEDDQTPAMLTVTAPPVAESARKPFLPPVVTAWGAVETLTAAGGSSTADSTGHRSAI